MMKGKKDYWILGVILLALMLSDSAIAEEKSITLKVATLAPAGSPWMTAFNKVNRELLSSTGGTVRMKAYPGGVMGDDRTILRKMRIGQIQIAGLTGLGLGEIDGELQAMGAPFLFCDYEEVDYVLPRITDRLEEVLEERGYVLLTWAEIGFVYMMSGRPMASLEALRGAKVWMPEGDRMSQAVFQKAGVSPIPLGISDVLLGLQTGLVDVIYSTPFGALALQWFTKVRYITRVPLSYSMGVVVITRKAFESIPENERETVKEVFRRNVAPVNARTRKDNGESFGVMAQEGIQFVEPSPQELVEFHKIAHEAVEASTGKVFSKAIFTELKQHLADFRRARTVSISGDKGLDFSERPFQMVREGRFFRWFFPS
jgi:TRAP-type C4-dicarboxylate transport system substrate-binding protein